MRELEIDKNTYLIPGRWSELTKDDLLELCKRSLQGIDEKYQRMMLLQYFTGLSYLDLLRIPKNAMPEVLGIFDYLYQPSKLTTNHFPELKEMKGPEDGLVNFTFEQFLGHAEPYSYSISSGNYQDIDKLIGVLYNFNGPDENTFKLKNIPEEIKLAIYLFYQGCSNFIKTKFKSAFPSAEGKNTKPDGLEFVRLVNSLNLGDVSKNESIKTTNLYEALTFIVSNIEKNGS